LRIFDVPEAKHFATVVSPSYKAIAANAELRRLVAGRKHSLTEGSPDFEAMRHSLLGEADRNFFISISSYRRSFDMLQPAAAPWAHITLYYTSFFAARGLLALFGCWVGATHVVDVARGDIGNQELSISQVTRLTRVHGSHRVFWDLFYQSTSPLTNWVDATLAKGLRPGAGVDWQTRTRNDINYESSIALDLAAEFQVKFRKTGYPASMPSQTRLQSEIAYALLATLATFIHECGLNSKEFDSLLPPGARAQKVRALIFRSAAPAIFKESDHRSLLI
jgi:hypothetical protein